MLIGIIPEVSPEVTIQILPVVPPRNLIRPSPRIPSGIPTRIPSKKNLAEISQAFPTGNFSVIAPPSIPGGFTVRLRGVFHQKFRT